MYSNMNISLASISDSVIEERNATREAKKELKKDLINIGSRSQFHGLHRMLTRHFLLRIIWFLFFLASFGLCAYTIITNIQQYLSFGVDTLVKVVPQNVVPIPTISVCNQNPFITMEANEYIERYYLDTYNVSLISYENFDRLILNNVVPNDIDWLFYRTFDPAFNQTLRDSFGFTFEEQNVFCRLFFDICDRLNYKTFYHAKYGNCFIFNSGLQENGSSIKLMYQVAEEYGLEMGIFVGEAENPKYFYNMKYDNGIVIMIGDQNSTSLDQEGILVSPSRWANIALSKSTSQNLPQPYNDCQDSNSFNTVLSNEMKRLGISYDRHNCFTLCKQMIIIEKLGCYDMRYPMLFNSTPCNDKSSFEKIKTIDLDLIKCQSECPFECESTILDWDISYALFPNKYTSKIINATNGESLKTLFTNGSYDYLDIQQAVAGFFVYYDPLTVTEISQSPSITLADLFSNIGGALGLFLGISLLSLVELLEMGFVSLETYFKYHFSYNINPKRMKTHVNDENEEDKVGIISDIKKELKRTGISTTLHGVPNMLLSNRKYVKIVWLMFTLVSIGLCIFMIVRGITSYLQFEVVSNIRQVPQQNITFPSIQICNPNFLATREASAYLNEYYLKNEGVNITNIDEYFDYMNVTWFSSFSWPFSQTFLPNFNMTTRRSLGYSLEDMLLVCEFNSKPCNLSWFEWYSHPIFGNCYRFNTGYLNEVPNAIDLLTIDKPNSGLYMELFTGLPDDYYNFYFREWEYNSVNLYISSQGHLPMDKFGRPFKAGSAASVKLYHSHYANLPDPYSNCEYAENMNTNIVKNIRNANISYDRYNCVAFCQQILAFNVTGFYFMSYPNPFGLQLCESYDECMSIKDALFEDSVCSLMCPPECEQYTYEYDVSLSDFPSINYAYKLINDRHDHFKRLFQTENITYDMLKKSLSSFNFYFDELIVNDITASPSVEFVDLISNIGGIFGLFVGMSVLSFVEIIELTFNITNIIIKVKRLRKINGFRNQNNHILS